jgi:phosphatidylserine/phosphatidylglycerophosphate/cardiolipin synthase-like enzyme
MPKSLSRNAYVLEKLFELNGTKNMSKLLQIIFDPRHFIKDQAKNIQIAVDNINPLLLQDGYRLENVDERFKVIGADLPDEIEIEIHFEEIQLQIIEQIRKAKYSIWLAVAWLTDKELLRELYKKRQDGVNVRIIILDDEINNKYGIEYEKFFESKRCKAS